MKIMRKNSLILLTVFLIGGLGSINFACKRHNRVSSVSIIKPKNRNRFYDPVKDRRKSRTKKVKIKN